MELKRKSFDWQRRLWAIALAAVLVCIPMAGNAGASMIVGDVAIPDEAAPKPTVTIQGNVVVDKNKATGFYELALCVKTARDITDETGKLVTEEEYAKAMEAAEKAGNADAVSQKYKIKNYPFQSAAAAVHINLDALTAVTWGEGKPIYNTWMPTGSAGIAGGYEGDVEDYPRGIDLSNPDQPNIITDLSGIIKGNAVAVRLDSAGPDEITNTTALIESYDKENRTALLTLTANSTTTSNVIYNQSTPVVVVRFAYDLDRFRNTNVEADDTNFWVGLDRYDPNDDTIYNTNKAPLTYLAEGDYGVGSERYAKSDAQANESSVSQVIWYAQNMIDDNEHQQESDFYYYLGAETHANNGAQVYQVLDGANAVPTSLTVPKTVGLPALAKKNEDYPIADDPQPGTAYSFFQNLLTLKEETLRLELVNAETYRKATGSGGTTILFYDWDDSLIGSLVVDKGDVRADVEQYIEENLVHPALRPDKALADMGGRLPDDYNYDGSDSAQAYKELVTSLARDHTYRGKYPYTVGGDNALAVDDGEDYPLTNKLDYVFTKRVNTAAKQTVTGANGAAVTDTYVLPHKLTDKGMEDAALYPYVYGWAVVEDTTHTSSWKLMYDAKKIEDTWTTIGVGELSNVTPAYYDNGGTAVKGIPNTATAATVLTAPQFLADADERWIDAGVEEQDGVEYTTKYAYSLASNGAEGYFRFMDFSNIDAELDRYQSVNGARKDTIIVKAVYEPGSVLLVDTHYQMVEEPYYSKLSTETAATGGAYSVDITLERSFVDNGKIYGVSRVRAPAIRQANTVDQFWVENEDLNIHHNLPGATQDVANKRTETTYTNVNYENGEVVQFRMILSARQQKVDYQLMETYGGNVVQGGQRSRSNTEFTGSAYVVDNYNYKMSDSNLTDEYYDASYEDREGSHGFVLYATLNQIMQYASQSQEGIIATTKFQDATIYSIMADINLRVDASGTQPAYADQTPMRTKILAAAAEILEDYRDNPNYWNSKMECAELTYHQLQWYIIDNKLYDRETADGKLLPFCHLHEKCAALSSNKPRSWEDLVKAVTDGTPELIDQLLLTEVESLTHLRNSTSGSAFASVDAFKTKFVAAVNAGKKDWVEIQNHILGGQGNLDTYWWFDGADTNPAPTSLEALGQRAQYALDGYTYPDGVSRTTRAKLESARATWQSNNDADAGISKVTKVATAWVRMTNNLAAGHHEDPDPNGEEGDQIFSHDKFASFEDFLDAYLAALAKAKAAGYGYTAAKWEGLQHAILHMNDPGYNYNNDGDREADADYHWKDGKTPLKITSISTLLKAAQYLNSGTAEEKAQAEEALTKISLKTLEGEPFYLRSSIKGAGLEGGEKGYSSVNEFMEKIKAAQEAGATNWDSLQYYLVHETIPSDVAALMKETDYYWWKNGGTGTAIDFPIGGSLDSVITKLMEAALRAGTFGDPKAAQSVEDRMTSSNFYELTHLTPTKPTEEQNTVGAMQWYTDTSQLLQKMNAMAAFMRGKQGGSPDDIYTLPTVYWHQAQYWILTGEYLATSDSNYLTVIEDYWWYDKTEKPVVQTGNYTEEEIEKDKALMTDVLSQLTSGTIKKLSASKVSALGLYIHYKSYGEPGRDDLQWTMELLLEEPGLSAYTNTDGEVVITWAQLEYYLETAAKVSKLNFDTPGTLLSTPEAIQGLIDEFDWDVNDFPDGAINRTT